MIYILIFVWQAYGSSAPTATTVAEFNTAENCRAAANQILMRAKDDGARVPLLMCAAKGIAK